MDQDTVDALRRRWMAKVREWDRQSRTIKFRCRLLLERVLMFALIRRKIWYALRLWRFENLLRHMVGLPRPDVILVMARTVLLCSIAPRRPWFSLKS